MPMIKASFGNPSYPSAFTGMPASTHSYLGALNFFWVFIPCPAILVAWKKANFQALDLNHGTYYDPNRKGKVS